MIDAPGFTERDIAYWRTHEFDIVADKTYFDHAAMSPLPRRVEQTLCSFHRTRAESGGMFSDWWDRAEQVRRQTAELIGAGADEIAFVANVSMGINVVAQGLEWEPGDNVVITDLEFPSNVYPWLNLERRGVEVRYWKNRGGRFSLSDLEALLDRRTRIVSVSHVIAGNGYKNDIDAISELCRKKEVLFFVDAIQSIGVHELHVGETPCDFLVGGYYKWLFGPEGLAFLYVNKERLPELKTAFAGWAGMDDKFNYTEFKFQPHESARKFELGNLNYSAIHGAGEALNMIRELGTDRIRRRVMSLAAHLRSRISNIENVRLISDFPEPNRSQIVLVGCPQAKRVHKALHDRGIVTNYRAGLRISPHFYNTEQEVEFLAEQLEIAVREHG